MTGLCYYKIKIINEIHIKKKHIDVSLKLGQTCVGNQGCSTYDHIGNMFTRCMRVHIGSRLYMINMLFMFPIF